MVLLISKNILPESDSFKGIIFLKALFHYFITSGDPPLSPQKADLII